jgi:hypothetical protein
MTSWNILTPNLSHCLELIEHGILKYAKCEYIAEHNGLILFFFFHLYRRKYISETKQTLLLSLSD